MGTSGSFDVLSSKLEKFSHELKNTRAPLMATAMEGKKIFLGAAAGAGALGKVKGKRKPTGVRFDLRNAQEKGSFVLFYTGPMHLLNNPTRRHEIFPRRSRGSRTRRKGASTLRFNAGDGGFAPFVEHPGTKGKHFAEKAKAACAVRLPVVYGREQVSQPLKRTFS